MYISPQVPIREFIKSPFLKAKLFPPSAYGESVVQNLSRESKVRSIDQRSTPPSAPGLCEREATQHHEWVLSSPKESPYQPMANYSFSG